jgi:hypothetical protein
MWKIARASVVGMLLDRRMGSPEILEVTWITG